MHRFLSNLRLLAVLVWIVFPAHAYSPVGFESNHSDPTQGPVEQALGFYSNGSLIRRTPMAYEGAGYVKIFRKASRRWGTYDLVTILEKVAKRMNQEYPGGERLQIGDLSARRGGYVSGHGSHQNGLDADLSYYRVNRQEQQPNGYHGFNETFVVGGKLTSNFDVERNFRLVELLVETGRIGRIFVDPVIKTAFCDYSRRRNRMERDTELLRRLRPWPNHANHLHVRINCPENSKKCVPQEEPPPGPGCDARSIRQLYIDFVD